MVNLDQLSIQITASTQSANKKVQTLTESLSNLVVAIDKIDTTKFDKLASSADALSQGLSGIKGSTVKQITKVAEAIDNVKTQGNSFEGVAEGAEKLNNATEKVNTSVGQVTKAISSISSAKIDSLAQSTEGFTERIDSASKNSMNLRRALANIKVFVPTDSLKEVEKKFDSVKAKVQELREQMEWKSNRDTEYVDSKEMERDKVKIEGLISEMERLKLKKQELESHGGFKFNVNGITEFGNKLKNINKRLNDFIRRLTGLRKETKNTTKSMDKFSLSSDKLAKSLTRTAKMLRLMVVRMVLRKLIDNVIVGLENFVNYSDKFNSSISLLWNSMRQLGNSVAAAVAPLINALAPALNYIIQLAVEAVNVINQLISAITGNTVWSKAKTLTDDYRKSLDKTGSAAKKLNKQLQGFDALNNLTTQDETGASATKPAKMFEEAPIGQKYQNLAKKIKDIFDKLIAPIKKAWAKVGDYVVSAWKKAFESVGQLLKDIGRDFLEVWNQEETVKMFEDIFRIVGHIGSLIDIIATKLDIAWNKNGTGKKILEDIRDIFAIIIKHIEHALAYTEAWAMQLDFSPLLEAFEGWLASLAPVVDNIMGVFEDFYTQVILPLTQWTLEKGLPELLQVFIDFNEKVDWEKLRERLSEFWKHLEPFAERVGEGLILFIRDISDALADFINSEDFENFLKAVEDWMDKVTPEDVADGLKKICIALLGFKALSVVTPIFVSVIDFLSKFKSLGTVGKTMTTLGSGLNSLALGLGALAAQKEILFNNPSKNLGLLDDVAKGNITEKEALEKLGKTNQSFDDSKYSEKTKNVSNVIEKIATVTTDFSATLGLAGSSTSLLIGKLLSLKDNTDAATNSVAKMKDTVSTSMQGITESVKNVKDVDISIDTTSFDDITDKTNALNESAKSLGRDSGQSFTEYANNFNVMEQNTKTALDGTAKGANAFKTEVVANLSSADISTSAENFGKNIGDGVGVGIAEADTDTASQGFFSRLWDSICRVFGIASPAKQMYPIGNYITLGIIEGFKEKFVEFNKTATEFINKVKSFFTADKWTFNGIKQGLQNSFNSAINAIKNIWNSFANALNQRLRFTIPSINAFGRQISSQQEINLGRIPTFSTGGFPEDGLFMANSRELVGEFSNGKTAVANNEQIINGIASGVSSAMAEQNTILLQQNSLLRELVEKDFGISENDLFKSVQSSANSYQKRTGKYAFS